MLEYERSEGIDVNKTTDPRGHNICHYWYFLKINFIFQSKVCNCCHNLMQKVMRFNDIAIVFVKGNNFAYMSEDETINLLRNPDLN